MKDRVEFAEEMGEYIPDFTSQVVCLNKYTNEELSKKQDEMSLVMLINKIQSEEELAEFRKVSEELVDSIYGNAPEEIKEIYKKVLWSLLMKLKVPNEEAREIMGGIGGRGMGYLFENMEEMDIQAERRNTKREKQRADKAEQRADKAEQRADEEKRRADEATQGAEELETEIWQLKKMLEGQK